ncbi:MAG: tetratricopeptide repeat protein, partial [Gemmatimonadaceae bacterium]
AAVAPVMCGLGDGAVVAAIRARVEALPATDSSERTLRTALLHARLALYASTGSAGELETLLADISEPARAPVGPPPTLRTEELLGAARLKAGRPHEAVAAYERALRLTPNRSAALLGLARARTAAGNISGAADAYRQLLANWHGADPNLPALAEVKKGAGAK